MTVATLVTTTSFYQRNSPNENFWQWVLWIIQSNRCTVFGNGNEISQCWEYHTLKSASPTLYWGGGSNLKDRYPQTIHPSIFQHLSRIGWQQDKQGQTPFSLVTFSISSWGILAPNGISFQPVLGLSLACQLDVHGKLLLGGIQVQIRCPNHLNWLFDTTKHFRTPSGCLSYSPYLQGLLDCAQPCEGSSFSAACQSSWPMNYLMARYHKSLISIPLLLSLPHLLNNHRAHFGFWVLPLHLAPLYQSAICGVRGPRRRRYV